MRGRWSTGKTRDRKIKTAPEKMNRAALAAEARAKLFEHAIGLSEHAPESVRVFRIVGAMFLVFVELNRIRDFVWQQVDLDRETELVERVHDFAVKFRDGLGLQFQNARRAVAFQNAQLMIDKIKTNLESVGAVRDRRSR